MIDLLTTSLTWILLFVGSFFLVTGGFGLLRMPDFFTRIHAAGLIDTLGAILVLSGLMFYIGWEKELFKIILIIILLLVTGPATMHAMCKTIRDQEKRYNQEKLSD